MSDLIGSPAPAFELYSQHRELVSIDAFKGRRTLLVFIPSPFTATCDGEACALRDGLGTLEALDANVAVITTHAVPTHARWAQENGFTFPILSDFWPHGKTSTAYGAFDERLGVARRSSYVLDAGGTVRSAIVTESLGIAREHEAHVEALSSI